MQKRMEWWVLLGLAGCIGGQTGTPASLTPDGGWDVASIACSDGPDAATALGPRGIELVQAVAGSYQVTLEGVRFDGPRATALPVVTASLTIAPTQLVADGTEQCDQVTASAEVTLDVPQRGPARTYLAKLWGTPDDVIVEFVSSDQGEHVEADLRFVRGAPPFVSVTFARDQYRTPFPE